ncbi:MAG TPA: PAS domain S-box protein, partial [Desulfuromonadales bacterium]|nr:PAS domain S-box protein [Desulfuromonadales bacterium]
MVDFSQKLNVRKIEFSSLGIIAVYLVVASLWIAGSDHLLAWMISDPQRLTWLQTIKGWLFVVATAVLFFVLIRRQMISQWSELESSRVTLDLAPVGVAHVGLNGRCIRANKALCRFLGYTEDELGGLNFEVLADRGITESERSQLGRLLRGDADSFSLEKRYLRKNGDVVWGEQSVTLAREREGEPLYFICLISDIDRRKKTEQELHESERRYRELFEKSPHPMWVFDRETLRFLAVNDAAIQHYGYSREEFLSLTIADIRPPEDVSALGQVVGRKEGVDHSGVWRHLKKDGTIIFVEIVTHGLDFDSRPAEMVLAHDVTEVQRAHTELKKSEEMLKSLNRLLRVLSKGNETLVRARDEQDLFDGICEILVTIGGYRFSWIGLSDGDSPRDIRLRAIHGVQAEKMEEFQTLLNGSGDKPLPSMRALQSGEVVVVPSLESDPRYAHLKKVARRFGVQGTISLPLQYRGERFGVLAIYCSRSGEFDSEEVKLLNELAEDVSYGIVSLRTEKARFLAEKGLYLRHRAIEASSNAIMICDFDDGTMAIIYVNPAFEKITGYGAEDVAGRHPEFLAGSDRQQKGLIDLCENFRMGHSKEAVVRFYRARGDMFWGEVSAAPVFDTNGRISHYVIVINDITDRKRYEEQLEHQSNHDDLTDLPNRNLLYDRLSQSLVYAQRSGRIVAVMLLGLDRFKLVNESLGHRHGDELLRFVAGRLAFCARPGDTVARIGGDEFVISVVEADDVSDVSHRVREIQQSLSHPLNLDGHELRV